MAALTGEALPRSFDPRLAPLANVDVPTVPFTGGIWRLLALNNREIARSLFLYESAAAASDHVRMLQRSSDDIEVHLIRGPVSMQHGWYATLNTVAVMSCGRWYPAAGLCHESAVYSVSALRTALVAPDAAASAARTLAAQGADRRRSRSGVKA